MSGVSRGWSGLGFSLLAVLIAAFALGIFCYLGGMGMGDLKLCAAIGAWVGPSQLLAALMFTGSPAALSPFAGPSPEAFSQTLRGLGSLLAGFASKGVKPHETIVLANPLTRRMPYAPAIAIGTLFSFVGRH